MQQHEQRYTAETVLLQTLGVGSGRRTEVQLLQFKFAAYASQDEIRPGNRVLLVVDIELPERMHLYAPGSDYTPADLRVIDDEICFPPDRFDLAFELDVIPRDRQRAPEDIRH